MKKREYPDSTRVGLLCLRDHCTFTWSQDEGAPHRTLEVKPHHCLQCLAEARRRGLRLVGSDGTEIP